MPVSAALVVTLGGFLLGAALYGMLLALAVAPPAGVAQRASGPGWSVASRLALLTGLLGVVWNVGALTLELMRASGGAPPVLLTVAAHTALGFLPAVVVHLVLDAAQSAPRRSAAVLRWTAIALALFAAARHGVAAWRGSPVPDPLALLVLTLGFTALVAALLAVTHDVRRSRAVWVAALAVFAVSGLHLTDHSGAESWWMALVGHHASLPLAIAILQQHYRFAFADLFLRRALALLFLGGLVLAALVALPAASHAAPAADAPGLLMLRFGVWMLVAVSYPALQALSGRVVDRFVLARPDHVALRNRIARAVTLAQDVPTLLQVASAELDDAFEVSGVTPTVVSVVVHETPSVLVGREARAWLATAAHDAAPSPAVAATAVVPTVEGPHYAFVIPALPGGRRLLSDDLDLLQAAAHQVGRRMDALRVAHERCAQSLREEEMSRLATEAELRALRAQLNPHFLFNALTTIGYLIQAAPDRAERTLLDLTGVLRGVLRRSSLEFSTLGEETDLIRAYLDIERARFEERLRVALDVADELRALRVPSLLLQPIVENAVKHGIAPHRAGGTVRVRASLVRDEASAASLVVEVTDTGGGVTPGALVAGRARGFGLASVERRLRTHYGAAGHVVMTSDPAGTRVVVTIPVSESGDRVPAGATDVATPDPVVGERLEVQR